jgi:hypothetical protein
MKIWSISYGHYGIYTSRLLQQLWQLIHTDFTIEYACLGQHRLNIQYAVYETYD